MKYIIKRKDELNLAKWNGGSTTELFIFPENSSYHERNFEIRISSATIEETPSRFTVLPAYHRILMPITSPLKLAFDNQNEHIINPFEVVEFEGSWETVSYGLCTDFGVMLSPDWTCKLAAINNGIIQCDSGFTGLHALDNNLKIKINNEEHLLMKGDFFIAQIESDKKLKLELQNKKTTIIALITKK